MRLPALKGGDPQENTATGHKDDLKVSADRLPWRAAEERSILTVTTAESFLEEVAPANGENGIAKVTEVRTCLQAFRKHHAGR